MVRVIDLNEKMKKLKNKCDNLERITAERLKGFKILDILKPNAFTIFKDEKLVATVFVPENYILNLSKEEYNDIFSLAEEYEKKTGSEWFLKTLYNE